MATVVGGSIGAVVFGVIAYFLPEDVRELFLKGLGWLDCCLSSVVLVVGSVVTIAGFLLWHSLLLAALAGGSVIVIMLIVLSVVAASCEAGNQSSSSRCAGMGGGVRPWRKASLLYRTRGGYPALVAFCSTIHIFTTSLHDGNGSYDPFFKPPLDVACRRERFRHKQNLFVLKRRKPGGSLA